jgi:hypothetical protein
LPDTLNVTMSHPSRTHAEYVEETGHAFDEPVGERMLEHLVCVD